MTEILSTLEVILASNFENRVVCDGPSHGSYSCVYIAYNYHSGDFLAPSAAPSGDAGNGNHIPATRLFHAPACLYFELKAPTCIESSYEKNKRKKVGSCGLPMLVQDRKQANSARMGRKTPFFSF